MNEQMQYSKDGLMLTEGFEGCKLESYQDQVGVWTIGYGHTHDVTDGMTCDQDQAESWLLEDVQDAVTDVNRHVAVTLSQNQFDACVDFVFNLGNGNFNGSTLLRLLNSSDYAGAAQHFKDWDRAGGVVRSGLLRRRLAEESLFEKEDAS